jgi:hypothetical protein
MARNSGLITLSLRSYPSLVTPILGPMTLTAHIQPIKPSFIGRHVLCPGRRSYYAGKKAGRAGEPHLRANRARRAAGPRRGRRTSLN